MVFVEVERSKDPARTSSSLACSPIRVPPWIGTNFAEIFMDEDANAEFSEYIANRIRDRVDDPVLACDHALLLKRIIKAAARKHGFVACFMAKPFAEDAGNGP